MLAPEQGETMRRGPTLISLFSGAGGLDYGAGWPPLPGTRAEVAALSPLAPVAPQVLAGADATAVRLLELLPKARWAHLATHGLFQAAEFAAECHRELEARRAWREGLGDARRGAKNPLGYVGLVLSGGEVMSGLTILDLDLANLQLAVLSACETGLGEYTGGEGVQGLVRAFHLAGCPNVVASLWKVNDDATAALTRTESRGAHFRTDFPERDDTNWRVHLLWQRGVDDPTSEPVR